VPFGDWTYQGNNPEWSSSDAHDIPGSGSALLTGLFDPGNPSEDTLSQAVAALGPARYSFGAKVRIPAQEGLAGDAWIRLAASTFSTTIAETPRLHPQAGQGDWRTLSAVNVEVPAISTLAVELHLAHAVTGVDMRVFFDDVYLVRVEPCVEGGASLCVDHLPGDKRFKVDVEYFTARAGGAAGSAHPVSLQGSGIDGGFFWMFGSENPEILVKVLDGCAVTGSFWVFASAATDVGFKLTVLDTLTGNVLFRSNPDGHLALPVAELGAVPCGG